MTKTDDQVVKILFRFFSNLLDEWTVETMWAENVDKDKGLFKLNNIPFYASVAAGDIVFAEYDDDEQMLTYRETIEYSGNSTVQVILLDDAVEITPIRDSFKTLGCDSERANDKYFVMEIPTNKDYNPIRQKLIELEDACTISYAEPCLARNHWYD